MEVIVVAVGFVALLGLGMLAAGYTLTGVLMMAPAAAGVGYLAWLVVRAARQRLRWSVRSPLADDPVVAGRLRLAGVLVLLLCALALAGVAGVLLFFGGFAVDPAIAPGRRVALALVGLALAGIPGLFGGLLLVQGLIVLRGDPAGAGGAAGGAALALVVAVAVAILEAGPAVLVVGGVTVVLALCALVALARLALAVQAAEVRRRPA